MDIQFNSLEVLKMAMNIEEQGKKFYQKCVEVNTEPKVKEIFAQLRDDEKEHYQYFKDLLAQFDEADKSTTRDYLYNQQVNGYLKSLVDTKVFPSTEEATNDIAHNLEEAVEMGIDAEKNSLLLYQELIEVEEDDDTIEALKKLILEEKRHLVQLRNIKNNY
ncbi:ferritin-like domain-containing protein [Sporohalobacter salinus]|uniref:ferritin-like domain-containing protein n=1 Tax=Sporohalobacter salinus TaxID=1494606 RepID=UPI00195F52D9|nr:ferritin family protein [Sporohalobacter salinus]MBM7623616.1 rubrerythrin [Sporohalobacter salinus]